MNQEGSVKELRIEIGSQNFVNFTRILFTMSCHKFFVVLHLIMLCAYAANAIMHEKDCYATRSNYAPVVGIMAEDSYTESDLEHGSSHIEASYVKWAEMAGMRVVPVLLNRSQEYYASVYKRVNGLILPGGGVIMGG